MIIFCVAFLKNYLNKLESEFTALFIVSDILLLLVLELPLSGVGEGEEEDVSIDFVDSACILPCSETDVIIELILVSNTIPPVIISSTI